MRRGCSIIEPLDARYHLRNVLRHDKEVIRVVVTRRKFGCEDGALNDGREVRILKIERPKVPVASDYPRGIERAGDSGDLLQDGEVLLRELLCCPEVYREDVYASREDAINPSHADAMAEGLID